MDEGYSAVTQNNGKQVILAGGGVHLLTHRNWKFEKFVSHKIQTDNLERLEATSADNVLMTVSSTINWRIFDVGVAARMSAETMGARVDNMDKMRNDVLKQAGDDRPLDPRPRSALRPMRPAALVSFSFRRRRRSRPSSAPSTTRAPLPSPPRTSSRSATSAARRSPRTPPPRSRAARPSSICASWPMRSRRPTCAGRDGSKRRPPGWKGAAPRLAGATRTHRPPLPLVQAVTRQYGVEIISINIMTAKPADPILVNSLAKGAVAAAEAQQAETAARGNANAAKIAAEGEAQAQVTRARGAAEADRIRADGAKAAADTLQSSPVAVALAQIDRTGAALEGASASYFFGADAQKLGNLLSNPAVIQRK